MRLASLEFLPASIPYLRPEVSARINRGGVTDVVVKATTDDGLVGWGESCSGPNVESVVMALEAMKPFVLGRSPWKSEAIRAELWCRGLWQLRKPTACFAYAGIDMALWDLCGKACGQPLYNLFGGKVRDRVNHFYYLERGSGDHLVSQCREGLASGYRIFYLKVGLDIEDEVEMVRAVREAAGPDARIRIDANGAWGVNEAIRNLARFEPYGIDFVEQPVPPDPPDALQEVRARTPVAVCVNEGLWSAEDAYRHMRLRTGDVYCLSPYWVGSLAQFRRLAFVADFEGLQVCRHTHGEFGIAAAAAHHVLLTLPNIVDGNQQTAQIMADDVLAERLPIADGPDWGTPVGTGLCVDVDEDKVRQFHDAYRLHGQFLPYEVTRTDASG
jgi:glucarate dehydratase